MSGPSADESFVIDTRLSVEEVAARLRRHIDRAGIFGAASMTEDNDFVGKVDSDAFWVEAKRNYNNGFASIAYGKIVPQGGITRVSVRFGLRRVTKIGLAAGGILLLLLWAFTVVDSASRGTFTASSALGLTGVVLVMVAGACVMAMVGWAISSGERRRVRQTLVGALSEEDD